jgi:hypothetical protein
VVIRGVVGSHLFHGEQFNHFMEKGKQHLNQGGSFVYFFGPNDTAASLILLICWIYTYVTNGLTCLKSNHVSQF